MTETKKILNLYQRMSAITAELQTVAKNLEVGTGRGSYKAVSESDVLRAVKPVEAKYGVYSYPYSRDIIEADTITSEYNGNKRTAMWLRIKTVYRFLNADNPAEFIDITSYADGIDNADKATGKAMTYCDKYALLKAYKINTGEDPDATHSSEVLGENPKVTTATPVQVKEITELTKNDPDRLAAMLAYYKADSIDKLTVRQASQAIQKMRKPKDE